MTILPATRIGSFTLTTLLDGAFAADETFIAGAGTPEGKALIAAAGHEAGYAMEPVNGFALERDGRLWLIDTGVGRDAGPDFGHFADRLAELGYEPDDVDTIILTHLHEDHIGGLLHGGERVFPSATLLVPERELAFWSDPAAPLTSNEPRLAFEQAQAVLQHYRGRIEPITEGQPIADGVSFWPLYGHTAGHSGVLIEDGAERLLMWADITHSSMLQLAYPDWTIGRDGDPAQAAATRQALLAELADTRLRVAGSHHVGTGRIERAAQGYRFVAEVPATTAATISDRSAAFADLLQ